MDARESRYITVIHTAPATPKEMPANSSIKGQLYHALVGRHLPGFGGAITGQMAEALCHYSKSFPLTRRAYLALP